MRIYPVRFFNSLRRLAPVSLILLAACSSGGGGDTPAATTFSIGGSITGLSGTVVLQNNGGNNLSVSANGSFTFSTKLADGAAYNVTVLTQPAGQLCTASSNTGTVAGANVTSVAVSCAPVSTATYTVGGTVTGLTGTGLVLQNNSADNLSGLTLGSFTFSTPVADGAPYSVSVLTQPSGQTCSVSNGTGNVSGANVTSVTVNCTAITYRVKATVLGLLGSIALRNNGGDLYNVSADGTITFPTPLPDGAAYDVTAVVTSGGQTCTPSNNTGIINGADVTATVTCSTNTWTVGGTAGGGGGLTGLGLGKTVVLKNNGSDDLSLTADGDFVFVTPIAQDSSYNVTVTTQPANQICSVVNGTGNNIMADVTDVAVNCVNTYTIGGFISGGVNNGGGPTLQNNGGDTLAISVTNIASAPFTFSTPIADGSTYSVTQLVRASAPIQDCVVSGGDDTFGGGTVAGANVTSILVTCTPAVLIPKFAYVTNSTADFAPGAVDTVSGFTVDGAGALTDIVGSPYDTSDIPQSLVIEPSGKFAYIANYGLDNIMVYSINAASGALTRIDANGLVANDQLNIPTGDGPFSFAIHPSGNYAYVVNQFDNTISGYTINATSGALSIMADVDSAFGGNQSAILTGSKPYALTIDPTGRFAYVANYDSGTVWIYAIDQTSGTLAKVGTAATGTNPSAVAVDPTGACALVTNNSSANVSAYQIDQNTGVLSAAAGSPFAAGTSPRSVAIDPSGQYAYVANAGSDSVSGFSLNPANCVITAMVTDAVEGVNTYIDAGGTTTAPDDPATPVSITVEPSGQFVYVANLFSDNVTVYSMDASGALTVVEHKPTGSGPISVTVLAQ